MFGKHIAHSLQRRASSNKVIEDDAVRLFGEIVHIFRIMRVVGEPFVYNLLLIPVKKTQFL